MNYTISSISLHPRIYTRTTVTKSHKRIHVKLEDLFIDKLPDSRILTHRSIIPMFQAVRLRMTFSSIIILLNSFTIFNNKIISRKYKSLKVN